VLGLAACGFAPYIDQHDLAAGEDWQRRLTGLIAEADTVVYVISDFSLAAEHCSLELASATGCRSACCQSIRVRHSLHSIRPN
jgi:hypothetical protein